MQRVYEIRDEIAIFLEEKNRSGAEKFRDNLFVIKLSYLNFQLQGAHIIMMNKSDKVNAFCRKLELWNTKKKYKCYRESNNFILNLF